MRLLGDLEITDRTKAVVQPVMVVKNFHCLGFRTHNLRVDKKLSLLVELNLDHSSSESLSVVCSPNLKKGVTLCPFRAKSKQIKIHFTCSSEYYIWCKVDNLASNAYFVGILNLQAHFCCQNIMPENKQSIRCPI